MKVLLKDIADIKAGQGAPQDDEDYSRNGIPFIKAGNLQQLLNGLDVNNLQKVSNDVASQYKLRLYPKGTILFAKSGMSCMKGYIYVLPCNAYVVNHLACIIPYGDYSDYLKYYLTYHKPSNLIKDNSYPSISLNDIGNQIIDFKTEKKQKTIVKQMKLLEQNISCLKKASKKYDDFIKARFIEMFKSVNDKVTIGSLCDVTSGYSFKSKDINSSNGIKLLQIGNVFFDNVNWETVNYLPDGYNIKYSKFLLNEGDIVVALTRPIIQSLGNVKACVVRELDVPCLLNQRVGRITPKKNIDANLEFIYECLMMNDFTKYVESCCIGCSQPNISVHDIENYLVPNVSLKQQESFVLFKKQVDKSRFDIKKSITEIEREVVYD